MADEFDLALNEAVGVEETNPAFEDFEHSLQLATESAVDYIDEDIAEDRKEATKFYYGEPFGNEETGRSQVVSRDLADTVEAILPSLMRVFFGSDRTVEYLPRSLEDAPRGS